MNIHKILLTALLSFFFITATAQGGFKIGMNIANMSGQNIYTKSKALPRLQFGFTFNQIKFSDKTGMAIEMLMTWKGQHHIYEQSFESVSATRTVKSDYKDKFTYFEMPFLISTSVSEKLRIQFGPTFGMRFSGKKTGKTTVHVSNRTNNASSTEEYSEDARYGDKDKFPTGSDGIFSGPLKTFETGLAIGATYKLTKNIAFYGRYSHGLSDVFNNNYPFKKAYSTTELNKGIQFGILFLFN